MMAASLLIEEESGTTQGHHPHNGYYAGDFSDQPFHPIPPLARHRPGPPTAWARPEGIG